VGAAVCAAAELAADPRMMIAKSDA